MQEVDAVTSKEQDDLKVKKAWEIAIAAAKKFQTPPLLFCVDRVVSR